MYNQFNLKTSYLESNNLLNCIKFNGAELRQNRHSIGGKSFNMSYLLAIQSYFREIHASTIVFVSTEVSVVKISQINKLCSLTILSMTFVLLSRLNLNGIQW